MILKSLVKVPMLLVLTNVKANRMVIFVRATHQIRKCGFFSEIDFSPLLSSDLRLANALLYRHRKSRSNNRATLLQLCRLKQLPQTIQIDASSEACLPSVQSEKHSQLRISSTIRTFQGTAEITRFLGAENQMAHKLAEYGLRCIVESSCNCENHLILLSFIQYCEFVRRHSSGLDL